MHIDDIFFFLYLHEFRGIFYLHWQPILFLSFTLSSTNVLLGLESIVLKSVLVSLPIQLSGVYGAHSYKHHFCDLYSLGYQGAEKGRSVSARSSILAIEKIVTGML